MKANYNFQLIGRTGLALLIAACLSLSGFAQSYHQVGSIVYPFRAAPAIAKAGSGFNILYNNRSASIIDSVILRGAYWDVRLALDSVQAGRFEYDTFTRMYTNNRLHVVVPSGTAEDMYDLLVYAGKEVHVSQRSVKVVKSFSTTHSFIHISDTHVSRNWLGSAEDGYAQEIELMDRFVDVANIIAPDFVVVTGDLIHDYTRFNADSVGWGGTRVKEYDKLPTAEEKFRNYFEGSKDFRGVQAIDAPVFSIPGNHDFYGMPADDYPAKAAQWNSLCGIRVHGVSYAGTRLLFADDYLGDPVTDIPDAAPMSGLQGKVLEEFLNREGAGSLRIMAQHRHNRFDTTFLDKHQIKLVLNGHNHTPKVDTLGATPTLSMRPGVVSRSGEIKRWEKVLGLFRIFYVDGADFHYTEPLRFCSNPISPYNEIALNLTLTYKEGNTGTSTTNTATLINKFPVDLPNCRVRFVMKKGKYRISSGEIRQVVNTEAFTVIDVSVNLKTKSSQVVEVLPEKI